ncbi:related to YTH1 Protein of the 3` processing complex [Cephalotrichum gorgonifer]|uniref:Related to YTH1 Protein of the 3` processing complex n=1 Tax=Cephalotrichum gorgonifer TaxID=2041049 RepID=A0AAE8MP45_9PEZI|nr:related to YTH1 Protein of the 3` processing complex [Cephalotrichum gorgonifer]
MPHRHRTLVLNGTGTPTPENEEDVSTSTPPSTWVSKTDRHLQLINSSVYEKESQSRAKAIAESSRQRTRVKDQNEKAKLESYLRTAPAVAKPTNGPGLYEVTIEGMRFIVAKDGSKLVKAPGDINPPSATPKVAVVGGVKFFRSKTGNLYRDGIVRAHRKSGKVKKVDELCKSFSTTGNSFQAPRPTRSTPDIRRTDTGLGEGRILPQRAALSLPPRPRQSAPVCRRFGLYGYCDNGSKCTERHVFECPDFSNTGKCKIKGCKLVHRERASVLRKAGQRGGDDDTEDVSSDSDSVASDDVDSDEVEELFGDDDPDQSGFTQQKDYISF